MKKVLIVGLGSIGRRHTENFSKYFESIDIVDINNERINQASSQFDINKSFNDYNIAIKENKYDAVVITTPPHLHLPIAKLASNSGSNLFIEKPLGMNCEGWEDVCNNLNKKKSIGFVAYCHRFIPYSKRLKELIDKKIIGNVIHANMRWGSYLPDWHPWEDYRSFYMAKKEQGGGALLDESHGIDIVRYILGEVDEVFAVVDNISDLEITSDDTAFLTLKMKNKQLVHINFDLCARAPRVNFEIIGSKGNIIWDRVAHKLSIYTTEKNEWYEESFTKEDFLSMYPSQAQHFYDCCFNGVKPGIDIKDGLKTQKIIDASFKSNDLRKMIKV